MASYTSTIKAALEAFGQMKRIFWDIAIRIFPSRREREMSIYQDALRKTLLRAFREFDTVTALSLIAYITGHWGGLVAERDHHNNGRIISERVSKFIFNQEPAPNRPMFFSGRTAGLEEIWELGLKWAKRLVRMPKKETIEIFGEAFWEWLLTADHSMYMDETETDLSIVWSVFSYWRDFASV